MWAVGDTVTVSVTFLNPDGTGATGLAGSISTMLTRAKSRAGAVIAFPSLSSWSHVGNGSYEATFVPVAAGEYVVVASPGGIYLPDKWTGDVLTPAQADPAAALDGTLAAIRARTDRIGSGSATVISPVTSNGERVYLRIGSDYNADLDNALVWTYEGPTDLTGATVTLSITWLGGSIEAACVVTDPGEAVQTITADLTSEQTATLKQKRIPTYAVTYELDDDTEVLFSGPVTVLAGVGA